MTSFARPDANFRFSGLIDAGQARCEAFKGLRARTVRSVHFFVTRIEDLGGRKNFNR